MSAYRQPGTTKPADPPPVGFHRHRRTPTDNDQNAPLVPTEELRAPMRASYLADINARKVTTLRLAGLALLAGSLVLAWCGR